jgi:putative MFS transporter
MATMLAAERPRAGSVTEESIIARLERLPATRWHLKIRAIIAVATFFDGYDAVAIAFVLPALIGLWYLKPDEIALLISAGFAGQLIGAAAFGWLAERYGRIVVLNWTIIILAVFGLACAFATSYWQLVTLRFFQGLGIGGEIPVAATFIAEIASAPRRGRFLLLYQLLLPLGFMAASVSSIWIVPHLGWQWMFIIGAAPAILVAFLRRLVPESPRWLARHDRLAEADATTTAIEQHVARDLGKPLPEPAQSVATEGRQVGRPRELFEGIYLRRTLSVWAIWFCAAMVGYGLLVWLPTIFRTVYKMPVSDALLYSSVGNIAVLFAGLASALLIDRVGRKPIFITGFLLGGLPLLVVWLIGKDVSAVTLMVMAAISAAAMSMVQLSVWTYTPEIYPTRIRSFGAGTASAWARLASIIAPNLVAFLLVRTEIGSIFLALAVFAFIGALVVFLFAVETRKRLLEEISP